MMATVKKNLEKTSKGETTDLLKLNYTNIVCLGEVQFCNLASKITIYVRQETSLKRRTDKNSDKGRSARSPWYGNVSVREKDEVDKATRRPNQADVSLT